MSHPPSPYGGSPYGGPPPGGPPYGGPPPGGPPGPYGQPGGPRGGLSDRAKFWIGVALALPVVLLGSVVSGAVSSLMSLLGADPGVSAAIAGLVGLVELAALVVAVVFERTRWFAIGVIAGTAILLILAAGACVVLIVALTNSYS